MERLPDELILHIMSYLDPKKLVTLQHVSRRFFALSRDNNLWKFSCFERSSAERRRRRLAFAILDDQLAEILAAAASLDKNSNRSKVKTTNREQKQHALLSNWDPTYPDEKINWYEDYIQRHAEEKIDWFQDAGGERKDEMVVREATGAGILFDSDGMADKLVAPLDDGSISIWNASANSEKLGMIAAKSDMGLLSNSGTDLDYDTRLTQSQAIMTETGAVECVSIDSRLKKGFFAVQNVLNEVDLNTLQIVSQIPYPFPITALSEAHSHTPLTVGTNWTIHLHDIRKPPAVSWAARCEPIGGSTDLSFSHLETGDFGGHVSLSQPGALSILHLPTTREWDGNGDIWIAGRFTSMLNFDRRYFPRLRGTVHSGARLSCLTAIPHPFIPQDLRQASLYSSPSALHEAKNLPGHTIIAAGEYKGKGSLELYGLSSNPQRSINSSDSRTTRGGKAFYHNRQTASSSKLLTVAPHGTRIAFADGNGGIKWVERDATTLVRQFNINDIQRARTSTPQPPSAAHEAHEARFLPPVREQEDMVQRMLPTVSPALLSPLAAPSPPRQRSNLVLWTGDGKLGMLAFGSEPLYDADVFEDALEQQGQDAGEKMREREYGAEMRRALEIQAREVRWLRGYGLEG